MQELDLKDKEEIHFHSFEQEIFIKMKINENVFSIISYE